MAWAVIHTDDLQTFFRRAASGEDPEMLFVEFYANCEHEKFDANDFDTYTQTRDYIGEDD